MIISVSPAKANISMPAKMNNIRNKSHQPKTNLVQNDTFEKSKINNNHKSISFGILLELGYIAAMIGGMCVVGTIAGKNQEKNSYSYSSNTDTLSKQREEERVKKAREEQIKKLMTSLNIDRNKAELYHDGFLSLASIPQTNDGNEKGINAIMGYGTEKYALAMDFLTPIIAAQKNQSQETAKHVPNGLILYGPGGSGKTYMLHHAAEHLKEFGIDVKEIILDEDKHSDNVENIKRTFDDAEENFRRTGKYTLIKFPQDIDGFFTDREKDDEFSKEISTFLYKADKSASKGIIWAATANNPKKLDKSVIRRASIKMPIGKMQDFQIGDMMKYSILKHSSRSNADSFDYQQIINYVRAKGQDFTPDEYETFVLNAVNSYGSATVDGVIEKINEHIDNGMLTLDEEMKAKFKKDEEYVNSLDDKVKTQN